MYAILPHVMLCVAFTLHAVTAGLSFLDVILLHSLFPPVFWVVVFAILILYNLAWMITYFLSKELSDAIVRHYRLYIFSFVSLALFCGIIVFSTSFVDLGSEPYESNSVRFKEYLTIYPILSGPILFIWFPTMTRIRGRYRMLS